MKILVIEDEKPVADYIAKGLKEERYDVDVTYNGNEGLTWALSNHYDLIVLDLLLLEIDGLEILTTIRRESIDVPVLILTAKSDISDRVRGLNLGADDYLTKPFAFEELTARIKALLRRKKSSFDPILKCADLTLDIVTHVVRRGGKLIEFTGREYSLLEFFMYNNNRVLTRATISEHVWDYQFDMGTNIIEVYINRRYYNHVQRERKITDCRIHERCIISDIAAFCTAENQSDA